MAAIAGALGGSLISGIFGSKAAGTQASAAKYAANLQKQEADAALAFQNKEFDTTQANEAPFIKAGQGAVTTLSDLMKNGGFPAWNQTFQAPTDVTEQNDPGYKFRLQQGTNALTNSAAASGNLLTGNTGEALTEFGQNFGSNEYQNVYNRAMQQYQLGYNQFETNQSNLFNRYASLAGLGQTSTGQLGQVGQQAANNVGNISLTSGQQIGNQLNNAAYQQASGYVNMGNQIGGAATLSLAQLLKQFGGGGGGGTGAPDWYNGAGDPGSQEAGFYDGATQTVG
jgi:hypothetical protein